MSFQAMKTAAPAPVEITKEHSDYMLNVLPPRYGRGCFAMGEPYTHRTDGVVYYWASEINGKHFGVLGTKQEAEAAFAEVRRV